MLITAEMKMADAILYNHNLLPVINRLGVQLGFGDKNIEQVCKDNEVNIDFFLMIINAYLNQDISKILKMQSVSIHQVVDYLKATHRYYLERMIPEVDNRINALIQHNEINQQQFRLVKNFFEEYKNELYVHIKLEEESIYPYAVEVFKAFESQTIDDKLRKKIKDYPITSYAEEHSDIESKLFDLKNILIKYLPESQDSYLKNQVLVALFKLENDLNDHSRIENMVLVPRVAELEKNLI